MNSDTSSINEDGPSEFMFTFKKTDFSQVESVSSPPCTVQNIPWRIVIKKFENKAVAGLGKYLGFFLSCNKEAKTSWSCCARATLSIVSQKRGVPSFFRIIMHSFSWVENEFGFSEFMEWDNVISPEFGFIENDTVKFQAYILADTPKIVDLYLGVHDDVDDATDDPPQKVVDMLCLFANKMDQKIVRRISQDLRDATNSLGKEQQSILEEAVERLKGDFKISIDSAVHHLREEINSLKNNERFCPNCCNVYKKADNDINEDENMMKNLEKIHNTNTESEVNLGSIMNVVKNIDAKLTSYRLKSTLADNSNSDNFESCGCNNLYSSQYTFPPQRCDYDLGCYNDFNTPCPDLQYAPPQFECCCPLNYFKGGGENDCLSCIHCQIKQNENLVKDEFQIGFNGNSYNEEKNQMDDTKMSMNEPLQKEILFIGRDENGQLKTFKPASLEELSALKKKYQRSEILEMMKFEM